MAIEKCLYCELMRLFFLMQRKPPHGTYWAKIQSNLTEILGSWFFRVAQSYVECAFGNAFEKRNDMHYTLICPGTL